jgi:hypothetical protein
MKTDKNSEKVKSIINSCKTYEQLQSCFSFIDNKYVCSDELEQSNILKYLQDKAYNMRLEDITLHNSGI